MSVTVVGGSGLVGSAVAAALAQGHSVASTPAPRLRLAPSSSVSDLLELAEACGATPEVISALGTGDIVVNAAGLARPDAGRSHELFGANALLPAALAIACERTSRPFVHISSAAVHGNRPTLDETAELAPLSPYAESKALAERALLSSRLRDGGSDSCIYRPTSVVAANRDVSLQLFRMVSRRLVPVVGGGVAPQPLCLMENVGAAIRCLLGAQFRPSIALHPWEGLSIARLIELVPHDVRVVNLPAGPVRVLLRLARSGGPRLAGPARRAELYAFGQTIDAAALEAIGYRPIAGEDRYRSLLEATIK